MTSLPQVEKTNLDTFSIEQPIEEFPSTLIAIIEKFYPNINGVWEEGTQITDTEGNLISRTFSELVNFAEDANLFTFEDSGRTDLPDEDRYAYRVHIRFEEYEYYSANNTIQDFFLKWARTENKWFQQIIFKHKLIKTTRWDRPQDVLDTLPLGGCSTDSEDATPTSTGTNPYQEQIVDSNNPLPPSLTPGALSFCWRYQSLSIPFILKLEVGQALGAVVKSDGIFTLKLKDSDTDPGITVTNGQVSTHPYEPLLLTKPILEIIFDTPNKDIPTFVEVDLYGEEESRAYLPSGLDNEPDIMNHPSNTEFLDRLQPPGKTFPDNFWNDSPDFNEVADFNVRQNITPGDLISA